jgi:hypothetical protein
MLIRSTQDIKSIIGGIQKNTSWETLKPYVEQTETLCIIPIFGQPLFDVLDIEDFTSLAQQLKNLLKKAQKAIAYSATLRALPEIYVTISDTGVQQQNPEHSTPAAQWAFNQMKDSMLNSADECLNNLIQFLDTYSPDFPQWASTDFYIKRKKLLIQNATELSDYVYFPNSHYAFWRMFPFFSISEKKYLHTTMGENFLQELKDNPSPSAKEAKVIQKAKEALALFAFYEAIPAMQFKNTGGAMLITSYSDGINSKNNDTKLLSELKKQYHKDAQGFLTDLKKYLDDNADDFTTYKNSDRYKAPDVRTSVYSEIPNSQTILSI